MIYFIGAGPGDVDLITVKGSKILSEAGRIIFAGSLVNHEIVKKYSRPDCEIFDSSSMTLEEISEITLDNGDSTVLDNVEKEVSEVKYVEFSDALKLISHTDELTVLQEAFKFINERV